MTTRNWQVHLPMRAGVRSRSRSYEQKATALGVALIEAFKVPPTSAAHIVVLDKRTGEQYAVDRHVGHQVLVTRLAGPT